MELGSAKVDIAVKRKTCVEYWLWVEERVLRLQ